MKNKSYSLPTFLSMRVFKGYRDIIVQDLVIHPHTIRYRLAEYETRAGYVVTQLPESIRKGHWGVTLQSFVLELSA